MFCFFFSKVREYAPSELAKIYEKAVTRRNIGIFNPQNVFDEFKKNPLVYDTIEDHINLAHYLSNVSFFLLCFICQSKVCSPNSHLVARFLQFFTKLLLLDREDEPSDDNATTTVAANGKEKNEDEEMEEA